jgi:hypothetical protein
VETEARLIAHEQESPVQTSAHVLFYIATTPGWAAR